MLLWIGALIVLLGTMLALAWLPVEIRVHLEYPASRDDGVVEVRCLLGAIRWKKRLADFSAHSPRASPTGHGTQVAHRLWQADGLRQLRHLQRLWYETMPSARWLLRRCEVHEFRCRVRVGAADAMNAGIAFGAMWALVCGCLGPMSTVVRFRALPDVRVKCEFGCPVFDLAVDCMMRVRTGYLIRAGLQLVRVRRRRSTDGTPDSRVDADRHVGHPGNG